MTKVIKTPLDGLLILQPKVFNDDRGYFYETFQQTRYKELGIPPFVQDNLSHSKKNVLRGLHYQKPYAQGKLVWVTQGSVWDVAVDIRLNSPTFGKYFHVILSDENHTQFYVPAGFAHGYCVLSDQATFNYKCTDFYSPSSEHGIVWNDPDLNIPWPTTQPLLSPKDKTYLCLKDIAHEQLFTSN